MARIEVKDFSSNKELENKADEHRNSNELDNYNLRDLVSCMIEELKKINKELKKINS